MFDPATVLKQLRREPSAHKGRFGHVLVVAGSTGFVGAACMAAQSALRSGAGLVTLGVPEPLLDVAAAKVTACMTRPFPSLAEGAFRLGALPAVTAFAAGCDVVALGPGMGRRRSTEKFVHALVAALDGPVVLDADGLNAFEGQADLLDAAEGPLVLTPHPGEMARLSGLGTKAIQADREGVAREFAATHGLVLVLKGYRTVVTDGERVRVNETGNPGMASGGMGDVLTGMVAGLLAQGLEPFEATALAVHVHGLAADIAFADRGDQALIATDLLPHLGSAFFLAGDRG